jgi:uncharacterized protein (DUF305 family)
VIIDQPASDASSAGSDPNLGAPAHTPGDTRDDVTVLPWWRNPINIGAIVVAIAVLAGLAGWVIGRNSVQADPSGTDVGFLQDMRWHHEQGVQIALMYLDAEGENAGLRTVAREIAATQSLEMGQMIQMLRDWGKPETNETDVAMTWMGHSMPIEQMPGLATDEQLQQLVDASGAEADQLFAELMIAHHEGGLEMARYAAEHARVGSVADLAESMVTGQSGEIEEMRQLVATLG